MTVFVIPNNGGAIEVNGKSSPSYPWKWDYSSVGGSYVNVSLKAVPAAGYHFDKWTGTHTQTENPLLIEVGEPTVVFAHFQKNKKDQ